MKAAETQRLPTLDRTPKPAWSTTLSRRAVLSQLERLEHGELRLVEGSQTHRFGQSTSGFPVCATIHVHDARLYRDVAFGGTIGAGESYMDGHWTSDSLADAVRVLVRNREVMDDMERGLARVTRPFRKLVHRLRDNSRQGSRRNIAAHYDLGNAFFSLFLDSTMMYSSAIFERDDMTLDEASVCKLERICRKLGLTASDHVLEIGTGWGGFAIHAATRHGCRVTTATISREQHELARARVQEAGVGDRVEVVLRDYRDLEGRFDKLVSIEMIEAVGHRYFDGFFRRCAELLAPEGIMLLQAITIEDHRFEKVKRDVDFIQRYIFPGGCLPSVAAMLDSMSRTGELRLVHLEDIGTHYARTLAAWHRRLSARRDEALALGYPEALLRMWEFYFCYCEGAFMERAVGDVQMLLANRQAREPTLLGDLGRTASGVPASTYPGVAP